MARKVVGADGATWTVGRRWLPWAPRAVRRRRKAESGGRGSPLDFFDAFDIVSIFDEGPGLWLAIGLLLVVLVLLVPFILVFGELLLLVLLLPLWVAGRVLLRQPWIVVAKTSGPAAHLHARKVVGWKASADAIDELSVGDPTLLRTPESR